MMYIGEILESNPSEIIPKPQMMRAIIPMGKMIVLGLIGSEGCLSVVCSSCDAELGMRKVSPANPPKKKEKPKKSEKAKRFDDESSATKENKITNPK